MLRHNGEVAESVSAESTTELQNVAVVAKEPDVSLMFSAAERRLYITKSGDLTMTRKCFTFRFQK